MPTPPSTLPGRGGPRFVTDGGLETDLIFHHGVDLPEFAAFPLLDDPAGRGLLADYYRAYAAIAATAGAHLLLESPTWRANPDWGTRVGYGPAALARVNEDAIAFLRTVAAEVDVAALLVGAIGPRGDGYAVGSGVDPDSAADYHRAQVAAFARAGADLVAAYTLTDTGEAVGIVRAARAEGLPVAISFTVETDGRLPGGQSVADAIRVVDALAAPDYYLLNCAHPEHMAAGAPGPDDADGRVAWERILGLLVNASTKSHAELDEATEIDEGDLPRLVAATAALREACGPFTVLGGCCGTDARHVAALWADAGRG